jgi:uncharacterized protein (TIGR01244 family)
MSSLLDIYNFLPLTETWLTSGQPTREQFTDIAEAGVKTVINLALTSSTNAIQDEAQVVKDLGMEYIHIPVLWENPTLFDLDQFFAAMDAQAGQKVLVHCAANMRVSALSALYRAQRLGWNLGEALKDTHQIWDPYSDPVWAKFMDSAQKR